MAAWVGIEHNQTILKIHNSVHPYKLMTFAASNIRLVMSYMLLTVPIFS